MIGFELAVSEDGGKAIDAVQTRTGIDHLVTRPDHTELSAQLVFYEFLRDVQDAVQDAALYALYVALAFFGEWLARALEYHPPFPLAVLLAWLPGMTLVFLVLMPLVRLVIRRIISMRELMRQAS